MGLLKTLALEDVDKDAAIIRLLGRFPTTYTLVFWLSHDTTVALLEAALRFRTRCLLYVNFINIDPSSISFPCN